MQISDQEKIKNKHLENLFSRLDQFKSSKKFCDVSVKVFDENADAVYDAHKILLAANSAYFKSMFNTGFSLSGDNNVSLIGVTSIAFKQIIKFFYSGDLCLKRNIITLILQSADFLQIDSITKILLKHIKNYQFSLAESLIHLDFMMTTFEKQLGIEFAKTVLRNFTYCLRKEKFRTLLLSLNYNTIKYLIESDVNDGREIDLLDFLIEWLIVNSVEDQQKCNELLNSFRLNEISPDDLKSLFERRNDFIKNLKIPWLEKANKRLNAELIEGPLGPRNNSYYYIMFLNGNERIYYDIIQDKFVQPSECSIIFELEKIINCDGNKRETFSSLDLTDGNLSGLLHYPQEEMKLPTYMRYDNKIWQENYKCALSINSYVKYGHCIIHVGGWDENRHLYLKGSAIYGQGPWTLFGSMTNRRGSHSLVMESGVIYAIGGKNEEESLRSVECLQINGQSKEWKTLAPMPIGRHSAAVTCLDEKIYVFGGYTDPNELDTKCIETNLVYDTRLDKWSEIPSIDGIIKIHAAINCFGKIFLAVSLTKEIEKFSIMQLDPETNKWTKRADGKMKGPIKYATKFSKYDFYEV